MDGQGGHKPTKMTGELTFQLLLFNRHHLIIARRWIAIVMKETQKSSVQKWMGRRFGLLQKVPTKILRFPAVFSTIGYGSKLGTPIIGWLILT